MLKYLVDEVQAYEEDHSDALRPRPRGTNESLFGERQELQPVSCSQHEHSVALINSQLNLVLDALRLLSNTAQPVTLDFTRPNFPLTARWHGTLAQPTAGSSMSVTHPVAALNHPPASLLGVGQTALPATPAVLPAASGAVSANPPLTATVVHTAAGARIPALIAIDGHHWRCVVKDWEEADPARGLEVALKLWSEDWTSRSGGGTGYGSSLASLYCQRKKIAVEFIEQ